MTESTFNFTGSDVPPNSIETERALLGSLMIDRDAVASVADWVTEKAFFDGRNGIIYRAMLKLWDERKPCDHVTLTEFLERHKVIDQVGGYAYIGSLFTEVPTAVHAPYYGEIIMRLAKRRAAIKSAEAIVGMTYAGDIDLDELVAKFRRDLAPFAEASERPMTFAEKLDANARKVLARWEGELDEHVIPTGVPAIDSALYGGLRPGNLCYVAGRPGMGKSVWMMQMAAAAAELTGKTSIVASLEMSEEEIFNRLVASEAEVPFGIAYARVRSTTQEDAWLRANERLKLLPLHVDDHLNTTAKLRGFIERMMADQEIGIVFVDHLSKLRDQIPGNSQEAKTSEISNRLKQLAVDAKVPVVCLSQLSRAVEEQQPFRPELQHLKYSGSLEADADIVFLMYRRRYYVEKNMLAADPKMDYVPGGNLHKVELNLAKSRNGEVRTFEMGWEPRWMKLNETRRAA